MGELVLVKNKKMTQFGKDTYQGPWEITTVNDNRNLSIKRDNNQQGEHLKCSPI